MNPDWEVPELGWYALPPGISRKGRVRVTEVSGEGDARVLNLEWDAQSTSGGQFIFDRDRMPWDWVRLWTWKPPAGSTP